MGKLRLPITSRGMDLGAGGAGGEEEGQWIASVGEPA